MADGPNKPNRPIRPRQGSMAGRRKRRVVIDQGRPRQDSRQARDRQESRTKSTTPVVAPTGPVTVPSGVTVKDLSQAIGVGVAQIIKLLMNLGQMRTATQSLSDEEVELVASEVNREIIIKHAADEEDVLEDFEDTADELVPRPPVVTI